MEQVTELTGGGADRGVDAVGYQAHDADGVEHPEIVLNELVQEVKPTGGIGVVGVCLPEDPGAAAEAAKQGKLAFDYGTFFFKSQSMGTGHELPWNRPLKATTGSTSQRTAGPRSCCTPPRLAERHSTRPRPA